MATHWMKSKFDEDTPSDWQQHKCSKCKRWALFEYKIEPDYDEGIDGEMYYCGDQIVGIEEYLTPHCPWCGEGMNNPSSDFADYIEERRDTQRTLF